MKIILCTMVCTLFAASVYAQVSLGIHYSTFNLPAPQYKIKGFGFGSDIASGNGSYTIMASYFSRSGNMDSTGSLDNNGITTYIRYQENHKFIHLSASFNVFFIGSPDPEDKFSLFLGGGLGAVYKMQTVHYKDLNETVKENNMIAPGFDFSMGLDCKAGPVKIFIKGKATIFTSHVLPISDDTAIPLLANTQIGLMYTLGQK